MSACPICGSDKTGYFFTKNGYNLYRCSECGVIYLHPLPIPERIGEYYRGGYHSGMLGWSPRRGERIENQPVETRGYLRRAEALFTLLRRYHPQPGKLLEIGCAAGMFLHVAMKNGWETVGVEINPVTAEHARREVGCPVITAPFETIRFEPEEFDSVAAWDVIEHLTDPAGAIRQIRGLLKPGGIFGLITPNSTGLFPRLSLRPAKWLDFWPHPTPPQHLFQFTENGIIGLLESAGFEILRVKHDHISPGISFGPWKHRLKTWRRTLYFLVFIGPVLIGPLLRSGDVITIVSRRR